MTSSANSKASSLPRLEDVRRERCRRSPEHFLSTYCQIYDAQRGDWQSFTLWPAQQSTLALVHAHQLTCVLKARQLGLSWLVLGYALWSMMFRPAATVLVFSKREEEAVYLLGEERLRGMHARLPDWLRAGADDAEPDARKTWALTNGSICRAFPTTAGDSYTASIAIVDEADLCHDLGRLLRSVKPTIDGGGKLLLVSRADKTRPESEFKKAYRAGKQPGGPWHSAFLPWHARPDRDGAWYARQRQDILARTGSTDDLHEQYPASDVEALAPRTLDKRIPSAWLRDCYQEQAPVALERLPRDAPSIPGLEVFALPLPGRRYVIGVDPAEGNPTSDDSAAVVLDAQTGEEVCTLAGKHQPEVLADYVAALCKWYNHAPANVERNNHGHAVLLRLKQHGTQRLAGADGREGWLSSTLGNTTLYDRCAEACRNGEVIIHSLETFTQLASIDGNTLSAPPGQHDDRADAFALANVARPKAMPGRIEPPRRDARNAAAKMPKGVFG